MTIDPRIKNNPKTGRINPCPVCGEGEALTSFRATVQLYNDEQIPVLWDIWQTFHTCRGFFKIYIPTGDDILNPSAFMIRDVYN